MITHKIKHYCQPTNNTCGQAALAILVSFFDTSLTPEEISNLIPVNKNEKGEDWGTTGQQLATWCLTRGFNVGIHASDIQILDISWGKLSEKDMLSRMELAKNHREISSLGKHWSKIYLQSYIDFVNLGGKLNIHSFISEELIDKLLVESPLMVCVNFNVLHEAGRSKEAGLRTSDLDDINGKLTNHFIVLYGKDAGGKYLVADPWVAPGNLVIEPERLIASIGAAQMECDNLMFQLKAKK